MIDTAYYSVQIYSMRVIFKQSVQIDRMNDGKE